MFCVSMSLPMRKSQRASATAEARYKTKPKSEPRDPEPESRGWRPILLRDVGDNPCANRTAAFANREAQALVHGDRGDQLDTQVHVVARHHHFGALGEHDLAGDVRRPEVELRTIVGEERG